MVTVTNDHSSDPVLQVQARGGNLNRAVITSRSAAALSGGLVSAVPRNVRSSFAGSTCQQNYGEVDFRAKVFQNHKDNVQVRPPIRLEAPPFIFANCQCVRPRSRLSRSAHNAVAAVIMLLCFHLDLIGQQAAPATSVPPAPVASSPYFLGAGDLIEVKFTYNPELDARVPIRPDGAVSLAMIGDVLAQGLSPTQLGKEITDRYSQFRTHPEAVVIVIEFAGQRVYIGGEVNGPGLLPLRGVLTGVQAVLNAGGPKATARLDNVILLRYDGKNVAEVRKINMAQVMKGKALDVVLQPYDVIYVPKTKIARVGLFVEQYVNDLVPRSVLFPYNLNNTFSVGTASTTTH